MTATKPHHTDRTYPRHDVISSGDGPVAHLSHLHRLDTFGAWYSLCGRVVEGWRTGNVEDTEHDRVCAACERKATRRARR